MDLYTETSYAGASLFTRRYSTSFSSASRLFSRSIQPHIYAIYGLVRIADEIVDTYRGADAAELLQELQAETTAAIQRGYSPNPLIHAFAVTAARYGIAGDLTDPFFASMARDLSDQSFDDNQLATYIYGSAEVVGLMCLRVFCDGDESRYQQLLPGARRLGAAYQKINFLRDIGHDVGTLGRNYFAVSLPLQEVDKQRIIQDITADLRAAHTYIERLPASARPAVHTSYTYYAALTALLANTAADQLQHKRIRLPNHRKALLLARSLLRRPGRTGGRRHA